MITDKDMREQIITILGNDRNCYDVNAIVDQIQKDYGTVDVNIIPSGTLYAIVADHTVEPDTSCHCH